MAWFADWGQKKKLADAAQHWARGGHPTTDDAANDLAAFGAPQEIIEQLKEVPQHFEVLPDAWPAVEMFLRLQTQWNVIEGGFLGLKYDSIAFAFTIWEVKNCREMLEDLQIMEFAALQVLNQKAA